MSESAPSIGSIGTFAYDEINDRHKGVIPEVARSEHDLRRRLASLVATAERGTRVNVRTFIGHEVNSNRIDGVTWNGVPLRREAIVPVHDHPAIAAFAYYGANKPERQTRRETRVAEMDLLERAMRRKNDALPRIDVDVIDPRNVRDADVEDIASIYREAYTGYLTDLGPDSVRAALSGDNLTAVIRDENGRVASICVAERACIKVKGTDPVEFAEISDAATRRDCRSRGYYSLAKAHVIRFLQSRYPSIVITTEARANAGAVLVSNTRLGMTMVGYQEQHCVISSDVVDVPQSGRLGNIFVFCAS